MLHFIGSILDFLIILFAWASFLYALFILCAIVKKRIKSKGLKLKEWCVLLCCGVYTLLFLWACIFMKDVFEGFFSIVFIVLLIISCQWAKYEDRKAGRRWWEQ